MNGFFNGRVFPGGLSPFAFLSGGALLVVASDRLAHALTVLVALVWVYCLSSLAAFGGARFFPARGRPVLFAFLASFAAAMYLLLLWILFPLGALQVFFAVSFIPVLCAGSGICRRLEGKGLAQALSLSVAEALVAGALLVLVSLVREPLGFRSLSLPGGAQGIMLFHPFGAESPLYLRLLSGSAGALLLLGYLLGIYRHFRAKRPDGGDGP
ncbi:MAG: hypothetical protein FWB79_01715 [Treponema sp.]|nr:hypothetical protein [Treponema sp.]